ncbi:ribbon-helix-helix domain-containing protein [Salinifilum ghardaiensis]
MSRTDGEFIDLEAEVVYDTHGRRITEADAEAAADAFEADDLEALEVTYPRGGRPSLSSPGAHSPRVDVRVPRGLKVALDRLAHTQGRRESELVREALEEYLARH